MPALDAIMTGGAIHISDQNKEKPIKTLCGQALDKDTTRYFSNRDNFNQATCKVCRSIYFDETWTGEAKSEPEEKTGQDDRVSLMPVSNALFARLTTPINKHGGENDS